MTDAPTPLLVDLLTELRSAVGDAHVLTDPADLAAYDTDWRGAYSGRPLAVVRPGSTAEVAAVLAATHAAGVAVVPQGGNTGMSGGAVPDDSGSQVVLSLGRMRAVREVDAVGGTITVESGCVLADVQAAAAGVDRLFPLTLGSQGSCTIGGNISTNAGGTAVLRYGMMRSQVLGLEVVLPDGRVWDGLRSLRKDNTGYDLKQLFIGAEGTLGVVTAAVLTLQPATPSRATAWVALRDVAAAAELLGVLRDHGGDRLTTWELVSRPARDLVVACGAHATRCRRRRSGTAWSSSPDPPAPTSPPRSRPPSATRSRPGWSSTPRSRAAPPSARACGRCGSGCRRPRRSRADGQARRVVPITALADFVARTGPAIEATCPASGSCLRPRGRRQPALQPSRPEHLTSEEFLTHAAAPSDVVNASVAGLTGSISAEHGLGTSKAAAAAAYKSEVEVALMRAVKDAIDPPG